MRTPKRDDPPEEVDMEQLSSSKQQTAKGGNVNMKSVEDEAWEGNSVNLGVRNRKQLHFFGGWS